LLLSAVMRRPPLSIDLLLAGCPAAKPRGGARRKNFQPNFVVSAKIRPIRISAEKSVQPAEFKKKIRLRGLEPTKKARVEKGVESNADKSEQWK